MFPAELQEAIEQKAGTLSLEALRGHAQSLSERYRYQSGQGKRLLTKDDEAQAYALVRMPATYAAVEAALHWSLACCDCRPRTLLDCGAGTGAASWAAAQTLVLEKVSCLEREGAMRHTGQALMQSSMDPVLQHAQWNAADLTDHEALPQAELVICAYVMNEMTESDRHTVVDKLWQATEQLLLIVEPGTPQGYRQLMDTRDRLLTQGAQLAAPCPHAQTCRLPQGEWCHSLVRVQRSRLHRLLKDGNAPYEDEKFMYMAFSRTKTTPAEGRVLRHPQVRKGMISLSLCGQECNEQLQVRKKDAELFRQARKVSCGDAFPVNSKPTKQETSQYE